MLSYSHIRYTFTHTLPLPDKTLPTTFTHTLSDKTLQTTFLTTLLTRVQNPHTLYMLPT